MIGRKNMGRAYPVLLVLLAPVLLLTMIIHNKASNSGSWVVDGLDWVDPVIRIPEKVKRSEDLSSKYHVAVTATDTPYSQWQCRIMYYWYKKVKDMPGSDMGNFTRVLHTGSPDKLMEEIPTFVVDPLPEGLDRGYVVLNRPWAFVQWLEKATIEEEYILMAEPDHIFLKPLPNLADGIQPAGYPFFYIKPTEHEKILRKFYPKGNGPVTDIDPIGNSPVIIKKPPWDLEVGKNFIIHYTYGCDYNSKGELTYGKIGEWRFDKRSYLTSPLPRNLSLPPPGVPESVVRLVKLVNEATANIPGWDTLTTGRDLEVR